MSRGIGLLLLACVACASSPAPQADPPSSELQGGQDIDVLKGEIDCRTHVDGKTEPDRHCCEENPDAVGCRPGTR